MLRRKFVAVLLLGLGIWPQLTVRGAEGIDWTRHPENTWVKQSPADGRSAPGLKYEGSGGYDPIADRWIHFGGHDGIPQGFYLFTYGLGERNWKQWFPNTSPPGVCCVDGSNVFDAAQRKFVAFPGGSLGHGYQWSRGVKLKQSNVWVYDPTANRWTNMRPPPYQRPEKYSRDVIGSLNSTATYDPTHEVSICFGGQGSGGPTSALFVYDAYANQLEQLRPLESPEPRDGVGLCYDTRNNCLVMFGSQYLSDERTWLYRFDSNRWEAHDLLPRPPGRKEGTYSTMPRMAYDLINGVCLCVVRRDKDSGLPVGTLDTWVLDVARLKWTKLEPQTSPDPSASRARNICYSPEHNVVILESVTADGSGPQIWTFRYRQAAQVPHPTPPADLTAVTQKGEVLLHWKSATEKTLAEYRIFRARGGNNWNARYEQIATTAQSSYRDSSVAAGEVYRYRVVAVSGDGSVGPFSLTARSQPRVMAAPVVSVLAADRIELDWEAHPAEDIVGYNLYRGRVKVQSVRQGTPGAWKDNDPPYDQPVVVAVDDIVELTKLNEAPLSKPGYVDTAVDLSQPGELSGEYKYAVMAYVLRAINRLGTESGCSPYALTIPGEPQDVLLREDGDVAELRWSPSPEKGVVGYHVYKLGGSHWEILRVTDQPVAATTFRHQPKSGETRYWVVPVDRLGQQGQPSSPVWFNHAYHDFFSGPWHQ